MQKIYIISWKDGRTESVVNGDCVQELWLIYIIVYSDEAFKINIENMQTQHNKLQQEYW